MSARAAAIADAPAAAPAPARGLLLPTRRLVVVAALMLPLAVIAATVPAMTPGFVALAALSTLALVIDAARLLRLPLPRVARQHPRTVAVGMPTAITLTVSARGARTIALELHDAADAELGASGLPIAASLEAATTATLKYQVTPSERGAHGFGASTLRLLSPWRLWFRQVAVGAPSVLRVYPDFSTLARYALQAADQRLSNIGVIQQRRRGIGLDFEQLREYREGDSQRQIDWKATARIGRLISRQYQDERDQQIVIVLDTGRRMWARDGALSHLDHAINAVVLLAYVALAEGDAAGLLTIGGARRFVPPRKSLAHINQLLDQTYDLEPSTATPDFIAAAEEVLRRVPKRALIVLVTNVRDEDDADLSRALAVIGERHRVTLASLRELSLDAALRAPVTGLDDALRHAAAADYLALRRRAFERLRANRVPCIDTEPPRLALALVNHYLALKRAGTM